MDVSKLNKLMIERRLTKADIIKRTGLSRPTIDAILSGKDFRVSNLELISRTLHVSPAYFFDDCKPTAIASGGSVAQAGSNNTMTNVHSCSEQQAELTARVASLEKELESKETQLQKAEANAARYWSIIERLTVR